MPPIRRVWSSASAVTLDGRDIAVDVMAGPQLGWEFQFVNAGDKATKGVKGKKPVVAGGATKTPAAAAVIPPAPAGTPPAPAGTPPAAAGGLTVPSSAAAVVPLDEIPEDWKKWARSAVAVQYANASDEKLDTSVTAKDVENCEIRLNDVKRISGDADSLHARLTTTRSDMESAIKKYDADAALTNFKDCLRLLYDINQKYIELSDAHGQITDIADKARMQVYRRPKQMADKAKFAEFGKIYVAWYNSSILHKKTGNNYRKEITPLIDAQAKLSLGRMRIKTPVNPSPLGVGGVNPKTTGPLKHDELLKLYEKMSVNSAKLAGILDFFVGSYSSSILLRDKSDVIYLCAKRMHKEDRKDELDVYIIALRNLIKEFTEKIIFDPFNKWMGALDTWNNTLDIMNYINVIGCEYHIQSNRAQGMCRLEFERTFGYVNESRTLFLEISSYMNIANDMVHRLINDLMITPDKSYDKVNAQILNIEEYKDTVFSETHLHVDKLNDIMRASRKYMHDMKKARSEDKFKECLSLIEEQTRSFDDNMKALTDLAKRLEDEKNPFVLYALLFQDAAAADHVELKSISKEASRIKDEHAEMNSLNENVKKLMASVDSVDTDKIVKDMEAGIDSLLSSVTDLDAFKTSINAIETIEAWKDSATAVKDITSSMLQMMKYECELRDTIGGVYLIDEMFKVTADAIPDRYKRMKQMLNKLDSKQKMLRHKLVNLYGKAVECESLKSSIALVVANVDTKTVSAYVDEVIRGYDALATGDDVQGYYESNVILTLRDMLREICQCIAKSDVVTTLLTDIPASFGIGNAVMSELGGLRNKLEDVKKHIADEIVRACKEILILYSNKHITAIAPVLRTTIEDNKQRIEKILLRLENDVIDELTKNDDNSNALEIVCNYLCLAEFAKQLLELQGAALDTLVDLIDPTNDTLVNVTKQSIPDLQIKIKKMSERLEGYLDVFTKLTNYKDIHATNIQSRDGVTQMVDKYIHDINSLDTEAPTYDTLEKIHEFIVKKYRNDTNVNHFKMLREECDKASAQLDNHIIQINGLIDFKCDQLEKLKDNKTEHMKFKSDIDTNCNETHRIMNAANKHIYEINAKRVFGLHADVTKKSEEFEKKLDNYIRIVEGYGKKLEKLKDDSEDYVEFNGSPIGLLKLLNEIREEDIETSELWVALRHLDSSPSDPAAIQNIQTIRAIFLKANDDTHTRVVDTSYMKPIQKMLIDASELAVSVLNIPHAAQAPPGGIPTDMDGWKKRCEEIEAKLADAEAEARKDQEKSSDTIKEHEKVAGELREKGRTMESEISKLENELQLYAQKTSIAETMAKEARESLVTMQSEKSKLESEKSQLETAIKKAEEDSKKAITEINDKMSKEVARIEADKKAIESELATLKATIAAAAGAPVSGTGGAGAATAATAVDDAVKVAKEKVKSEIIADIASAAVDDTFASSNFPDVFKGIEDIVRNRKDAMITEIVTEIEGAIASRTYVSTKFPEIFEKIEKATEEVRKELSSVAGASGSAAPVPAAAGGGTGVTFGPYLPAGTGDFVTNGTPPAKAVEAFTRTNATGGKTWDTLVDNLIDGISTLTTENQKLTADNTTNRANIRILQQDNIDVRAHYTTLATQARAYYHTWQAMEEYLSPAFGVRDPTRPCTIGLTPP